MIIIFSHAIYIHIKRQYVGSEQVVKVGSMRLAPRIQTMNVNDENRRLNEGMNEWMKTKMY